MSIGARRMRLTLKNPTGSNDRINGQPATFSTYGTVWAEIRQLTGNAAVNALALRGSAGWQAIVRVSSTTTAAQEGWRVTWTHQSRTYTGRITGITLDGPPARFVTYAIDVIDGVA